MQEPEQATLLARGNKAFALGNYEEAADRYAEAVELTAQINRDENPENAELFFLYGRALSKVAINNSQVLGGGEAENLLGEQKTTDDIQVQPDSRFSFAGDAVEDDVTSSPIISALIFQDEYDEGDIVDEEEEPSAKAEDEFENAWEILDLSRILFEKQLKSEEFSDKVKIKRKLAEAYDLLGEVSLENGSSQSQSLP